MKKADSCKSNNNEELYAKAGTAKATLKTFFA